MFSCPYKHLLDEGFPFVLLYVVFDIDINWVFLNNNKFLYLFFAARNISSCFHKILINFHLVRWYYNFHLEMFQITV